MICAKHSLDHHVEESNVEIFGDSSSSDSNYSDYGSDSDSDDDLSRDNSNNNNSGTKQNYRGEVVIVVASRYNITIQKRIPLLRVPDFAPSSSLHPHTYINKIVIGSTKGDLLLLNIRSGKIIHQFKCFERCGERNGKITTMQQSPAVDTIAIGTSCGNVHLLNIRMGVKLFTLYHNSTKKITACDETSWYHWSIVSH